MDEDLTPEAWLWRRITKRLGEIETQALRVEYNAHKQAYGKRKKAEQRRRSRELFENREP